MVYAATFIKSKKVPVFTKTMYERHIQVWNNFRESCLTYKYQRRWHYKCIQKSGPKDFVDAFQSTINSLREDGFDSSKSIIPVTKLFSPWNGAHRIATAIALKMDTIPVFFFHNDGYKYDVQDEKFYINKGFDIKYTDFAMLQFLFSVPQVTTIMFWPDAVSHAKMNSARKMISDKFQILYTKTILLNKRGIASL